MSNKISIEGFIFATKPDSWDHGSDVIDGIRYSFWAHDMSKSEGFTLIAPHTLEFEIPESVDPRAGVLKEMKAEKTRIMAEFQARITDIERQIAEFTAIEYREPT